jgi:hypothetical protein
MSERLSEERLEEILTQEIADCPHCRESSCEGCTPHVLRQHYKRLTAERDQYAACHEAELGVCFQHCDEVQELTAERDRARNLAVRLEGEAGAMREALEDVQAWIKSAVQMHYGERALRVIAKALSAPLTDVVAERMEQLEEVLSDARRVATPDYIGVDTMPDDPTLLGWIQRLAQSIAEYDAGEGEE